MIGRTAGVPVACPGTVTVTPCTGLASANKQTQAYLPDPKSIVIGLTVPGPVFSISAYIAPLAGSTRSTSPPSVPWLLIWMVCLARAGNGPGSAALAAADVDDVGRLAAAAAGAASGQRAASASAVSAAPAATGAGNRLDAHGDLRPSSRAVCGQRSA